MTITLDKLVRLPPNPNARQSWQAAMRTKAEWRDAAETIARETRRHLEREQKVMLIAPMQRCRIDVTVVVPDRRSRDEDNLRASLKPITDGIVRAGIIADDSPAVVRDFRLRVIRSDLTKHFSIEYRIEAV